LIYPAYKNNYFSGYDQNVFLSEYIHNNCRVTVTCIEGFIWKLISAITEALDFHFPSLRFCMQSQVFFLFTIFVKKLLSHCLALSFAIFKIPYREGLVWLLGHSNHCLVQSSRCVRWHYSSPAVVPLVLPGHFLVTPWSGFNLFGFFVPQ